MATENWWDTHDATYAARQAAGHPFVAGALTPGWCARCGCSRPAHEHDAWTCRPETCGGIHHDPCDSARPTLPLLRTEAVWPSCSTCDGGGCHDCTDPAQGYVTMATASITVKRMPGGFDRAFLACPHGHEVASSPTSSRTAQRWLSGDLSDEFCGYGSCDWSV